MGRLSPTGILHLQTQRSKPARALALSPPAGPSQWHKLYPIAQGDRQSPINIVSSQAVYSPSLKPLELSYEACISLSITNNGHSVQVDFNDSDDRTGKWPLPEAAPPLPLGSSPCMGQAQEGQDAVVGKGGSTSH